MLEVKDLVKKYGKHVSVDHLSFEVKDHQVFGFLGPNGAGKSTTMNVITGYIGAEEGHVILDGHDLSEEPEYGRKNIGFLPEFPPLYVDMTVEEYLKFCAGIKKVDKKDRQAQVDRVCAMTYIEQVRQRLIRNLSKGYKQRVGLAQALLGFPKVLILDEPTVGLDPKQIIEIRQLIRDLSKEHTVILSSHILSEVQEVCDTVLIINRGHKIACDTPEKLVETLSGDKTALRVKGSEQNIRRAIEASLGLVEAQVVPGEDNIKTVTVMCNCTEAMREKMFYAFAAEHCAIVEYLDGEHNSLEEAFLALTQQDSEESMAVVNDTKITEEEKQ